MQKKKEFGLAAQLAQPRSAPPDRPIQSTSLTPQPELSEASQAPATTSDAILDSERSDHTKHTDRSRSSSKQKKAPGAPPRAGGYVRRTITLGPALSDYIDQAWRTYRTADGEYVKGVSGYIEALIDEHRRQVS